MQLRWIVADEQEAALFAAIVQGRNPPRAAYHEILRKQYVEPALIEANLRLLERLQAARERARIALPSTPFVPGMRAQRLYSPAQPGPVVPIGMNVYVSSDDADVKSWTNIQDCEAAGKTFPDRSQAIAGYIRSMNEMLAAPQYEDDASCSRRVFIKETGERAEYWTIEVWDVFTFCRSGPFPLPSDFWYSPASQRRQVRKFPSFSSALLWYRAAIRGKLAEGFAESLPRVDYFNLRTGEVAAAEPGEVIFDSCFAPDSPGAKWAAAQTRPSWEPVVDEGPAAGAGSQYGGTPWISLDENYPKCQTCGRELMCLLQLEASTLPDEMAGQFGAGILQVFSCRNESCAAELRGTFSGSQLVRFIQADGLGRADVARGRVNGPGKKISGWTQKADYPPATLYDQLGLGDVYAERTVSGWRVDDALQAQFPVHGGDKLGGWPNLIYDPGVYCPECDEPMQFVVQLANSGHAKFDLWEEARGWVYVCPTHPNSATFFTQMP
jgi:hypothetical protein